MRIYRHGFSLVEMLVVIAIIAILIAILLPVIQMARETARRSMCAVKMKNLAVALHTFHDNAGKLPSSAAYRNGKHLAEMQVALVDVKPGDASATPALAPYSFLVRLLPYVEQNDIFELIDLKNSEAFAAANAAVAAKVLPVLNCPSYRGPRVSIAPEYGSSNPAISNYKSLGATTLNCMQDEFNSTHPDLNGGTLNPYAAYPLNTLKAPTQTAVLVETKEQRYAAWIDGTTAAIPGFHPASGNVADDRFPTPPEGSPALNVTPFCTALQWKTLGNGIPGDGGIAMDMEWGPSSDHPGLVNHAFAGTETRSIASDVDASAYRAIVSRQSNDNGDIKEHIK